MDKPILIIDPGHGGTDPGCSGNGIREKDYTLQISLYQLERFRQLGVPVAIIRMADVSLDSGPRSSAVKNSGAKYCISNHINAAASTDAQGAEAIHSIHSDGKLANAIMDGLVAAGLPKRRVFSKANSDGKTDYYYMHRLTGSVSTVIVEYDFATNAAGAERIKANWQVYAETVVRAFCQYAGFAYKPPGGPAQPEPTKPAANGTPILSAPRATVAQAQAWARTNNAPQQFVDLAPLYWEIAPQRGGVDPALAYVQFAHETGFLYRDGRSGAGLDASYCNPCGLKTAAGGGDTDSSAHMRFADWREGITAHVDHLALYAGAVGYPRSGTPDPRHFAYLAGMAPTAEALGGKWAPSTTYGAGLVTKLQELMETSAPFPDPASAPEPAVKDWKQVCVEWLHDQGLTDTVRDPDGTPTWAELGAVLSRMKGGVSDV